MYDWNWDVSYVPTRKSSIPSLEPRETRQAQLGRYLVRLDETNTVCLAKDGPVVRGLEESLLRIKTTSRLVRLDMAPWDAINPKAPPVFEVDPNPGGLSVWMEFTSFPRRSLSELAEAVFLAPSDESWRSETERLAQALGWQFLSSWRGLSNGVSRVYSSCLKEEVPAEAVDILITDPWMAKGEVIKMTGGLVSNPPHPKMADLVCRFVKEGGFCVKPQWGWGGKDVYLFSSEPSYSRFTQPFKRELKQFLASSKEELVIQPFFGPQIVSWGITRQGFLIWRIFAWRQETDESFRLVGGMWNARPHLKVHGASDTITGAIVVQ